jgi:hypothetical protein
LKHEEILIELDLIRTKRERILPICPNCSTQTIAVYQSSQQLQQLQQQYSQMSQTYNTPNQQQQQQHQSRSTTPIPNQYHHHSRSTTPVQHQYYQSRSVTPVQNHSNINNQLNIPNSSSQFQNTILCPTCNQIASNHYTTQVPPLPTPAPSTHPSSMQPQSLLSISIPCQNAPGQSSPYISPVQVQQIQAQLAQYQVITIPGKHSVTVSNQTSPTLEKHNGLFDSAKSLLSTKYIIEESSSLSSDTLLRYKEQETIIRQLKQKIQEQLFEHQKLQDQLEQLKANNDTESSKQFEKIRNLQTQLVKQKNDSSLPVQIQESSSIKSKMSTQATLTDQIFLQTCETMTDFIEYNDFACQTVEESNDTTVRRRSIIQTQSKEINTDPIEWDKFITKNSDNITKNTKTKVTTRNQAVMVDFLSDNNKKFEDKFIQIDMDTLKQKYYLYLCKYSYDPLTNSPNDNPEAELSLSAGDYLFILNEEDEDGFYVGESIVGKKGNNHF